ncbi:MAG: class II glutamine amidotransferase [Gaiellaceae bacterium]
MCRVLAYLGCPLSLEDVLYETDSSLVRQAHSPRMTAVLNLAGFGFAAWEPGSARPADPFLYRAMTLPVYDRNLRSLARKLEPTCVLAHVRGVPLSDSEIVSEVNLHPFRHPGAAVTLAHNGHLREFERMRFDLVPHVRPEVRERIEGTSDSAWLYAVLLSQLDDPYGAPDVNDLADATVRTLEIVRDVRARHGIDTSSPTNLFVTTGSALVATRFSYDYGWYPDSDSLLEVDLPYVSLWYTLGDRYALHEGEWTMAGDGPVRSLLIASEPLTSDASTWLEVPEYSLLAASLDGDELHMELRDLDV